MEHSFSLKMKHLHTVYQQVYIFRIIFISYVDNLTFEIVIPHVCNRL